MKKSCKKAKAEAATARHLGLEGASVIEAGSLVPKEFLIHVLPQDLKNAECLVPEKCAISNAIKRAHGLPKGATAAIGGKWAHIPMKKVIGKKVVTYIAKMQATAETQRAIKKFDRTGKMPDAGFRFIPLAESQQADARHKDYLARKVRLEKGESVRKYKLKNKSLSIRRMHCHRNPSEGVST